MDAYVTIGLENPNAADRWLSVIQEKADLLRRFPRIGVARPEIRPLVRILVEGCYLLLYEIHPDKVGEAVNVVEIVRLVDGRRDLPRLFL